MATRGAQKSLFSPNDEDDGQNSDGDDDDDPATKAEFDEFKLWLDKSTEPTPGAASNAPQPAEPRPPMGPPAVPIKNQCKCNSLPCILAILK